MMMTRRQLAQVATGPKLTTGEGLAWHFAQVTGSGMQHNLSKCHAMQCNVLV